MVPAVVVLSSAGTTTNPVRTYDLGTLRHAIATVTEEVGMESGSDYSVLVNLRFLPIRCFDAATNVRLNRERARQFAERAMERYLGMRSPDSVVALKCQVLNTSIHDDRFDWTARIRQIDVTSRYEAQVRNVMPTEDRVPREFTENDPVIGSGGNLLERKQDYLDAAETVRNELVEMVNGLPRAAIPKLAEDEFDQEIANTEDEGLAKVTDMRQQMLRDSLLLGVERDEIGAIYDSIQADFLKKLQKSLAEYEAQ